MLFAGMVWGVNVYVIRVLSTGGGFLSVYLDMIIIQKSCYIFI